MSSKDYRELQLSSSQLVIIFLAIFILGVIVFLLGVSVGKKQAQIVLASQAGIENVPEKVVQENALSIEEPQNKTTEKKAASKTSEPELEKAAPALPPQNLDWFIQVGAFNNKEGAQSIADRFIKEGYNAVVLDPSATDRKSVFRVRLGGYASKELAEKTKAELVRADPKATDYFVIRQR